MKKWIGVAVVCMVLVFPALSQAGSGKFVFLATTIGPVDAGIIDLLENEFEKESGIRVRHISAGTGAALKIAQKGNVDLTVVHAKSLEEKFVQDGYGTERIDFMYNDFVIVGPPEDPAGIKGITSASGALRRLSEKGGIFISRGDNSGTHVAEKLLWEKAGLKPGGAWYVIYEKGSAGNKATLQYTDERNAYTFMDRATYLSLQKQIKLRVLVEKDQDLLNFITLIPVNPKKFPRVNYDDTISFVRWLTAVDKGQKIVKIFGVEKYGAPLFFPNSQEWRKAKN